MNIPKVNHEQLKDIIKRHYELTERGINAPAFVWGSFGIGKSYSVREIGYEIAKEKGLKYSDDFQHINDEGYFNVLVIPLHQYDVSEIKGIPFPDKEEGTTKFFKSNLLPRKGQGIIFFDELNLAPPLVQSNAYQLILDRKLGDYEVPDGYLVIGAGNTAEDFAHTFDFANPLKNRFAGHYLLNIPSAEEWVRNFAVEHKLDERIIAFLLFRDDLLFTFNPNREQSEHIAIATPRTWEFASMKIEGIETEGNEELIEILVGSAVGTEVAREFMAFLKLQKNYDIAKIFRNPDTFEAPNEISEIYAFISASISYYTKNQTNENAETLLKLLMKFRAEHVAWAFSLAKTKDKDFVKKVAKTKVWTEFSRNFIKYFAN